MLESFASGVLDRVDARLILAGPSVHAVADDPEAAAVYREVERRWQLLPSAERERIELARLPMRDLEENAAIVNALQRQATVIVKKSLEEGFGLGVTEAMWKRRPVVASRVGGHQDQIQDGVNGVLLDDPRDLAIFGGAVAELLLDPDRAKRLGDAAQQRVRDRFLTDRYLRSGPSYWRRCRRDERPGRVGRPSVRDDAHDRDPNRGWLRADLSPSAARRSPCRRQEWDRPADSREPCARPAQALRRRRRLRAHRERRPDPFAPGRVPPAYNRGRRCRGVTLSSCSATRRNAPRRPSPRSCSQTLVCPVRKRCEIFGQRPDGIRFVLSS